MENQKTSIVSALEVLESIKYSFKHGSSEDDNNHLRHISALTNIKEPETIFKSSISENTIDYNKLIKDDIDIPHEELKIKEKDLVKSCSINKEVSLVNNLLEKKNTSIDRLQQGQKHPAILKSNSSKSKISLEKTKQNIITKNINNNLKIEKEVLINFHNIKISNKTNTNNSILKVISPKNIKEIHFGDKIIPNQSNNVTEKLVKKKETIIFEEKKMVEKKNYDLNKIEKNIISPIKNSQNNNSNVLVINGINELNNDIKSKTNFPIKSIQTNSNANQFLNNSSGFSNLKFQKVKLFY